MKKILFCGFLLLLVPLLLSAMNLDHRIEQLTEENAKHYIQPLATSIGTTLNSGWFTSAKSKGLLHFAVSVNPIISFVPKKDQTFSPQNPASDIYEDVETSATFFGNEGGVFQSKVPGISDLQLPKGIDQKYMLFLVPQATLGLPMGLELAARYIPTFELSDIGDVSFGGIAAKYEISRLLPLFPFAVAVQAAYQSIELGDVVDASSTVLTLIASKKIPLFPFTVYAGMGFEKTNFELDYSYKGTLDIGDPDISFDIDGETDMRFTVGAHAKFLLFDIVADYSIGNYSALRFAVGASL